MHLQMGGYCYGCRSRGYTPSFKCYFKLSPFFSFNVFSSLYIYFHPSFVESIFPDVCLCNACNLCNGNMSEYPMTHPQPPPTQELSHGHIYFTFQWCYEFALVFYFYYLTIKRQLSKNSWSMETKTNSSIFVCVCVCVCVCRSARDCGETERRCRSFGRNCCVLLPGPRRTDASTFMAQKWTKGERIFVFFFSYLEGGFLV